MALDLTAEHKEIGKGNANAAVGELTRRGFMKSMTIGAAGLAPVAAGDLLRLRGLEGQAGQGRADRLRRRGRRPVRRSRPEVPRVHRAVRYSAVQPDSASSNGEPAPSPRKGYKAMYSESAAKIVAADHMYTDIKEMLEKEKDIEAVVIALPLHLHAEVTIACMQGRQACAVRKADGPHHRPVQGDDQGRQGRRPHPLDRPSTAL